MAAKTRLGPSGHGTRRVGSFAGKAVDAGIVVDAFLSALVQATTGKKPGIPSDTPAWLRTMLEIITGRRGNRITVPVLQTLTFSASPTQAECEALYAYVNATRAALEEVITRLDS
jgi:hypothetical protein